MSLASILRRVALILTLLFGGGGLLFGLGYAWADLAPWQALLVTAAVVVPLGLLVVLGVRSASMAVKVLWVGVVAFALWGLVTLFVDIDLPTIPFIALILAVPIAVVGLRFATRAGELMLGVVAVPLVLVLIRLFTERGPEGPRFGDLLGGSTGVVVVPLVLLAALFLAAGAAGRGQPEAASPRVPPSTPVARR